MPRVLSPLPRRSPALLGAAVLLCSAVLRGEGTTAHSFTSLLRGCGSCHVGHGKASTPMMPALEEDLCYRCHGSRKSRIEMEQRGLLAAGIELRDISTDFRLPYRHPVELVGAHQPGEQLPERSAQARRHAECIDCHRPHRTPRSLITLSHGLITARSTLDGRSPEHEVCYRCHADSVNLPRESSNVKRRFTVTNASYHPVEAVGKARYVPSLRRPWTTNSMMACTDCHGGDSRAVHGSPNPYLMRWFYSTSDRGIEGPRTYALCYTCHDRQTLFSGVGFSEHERHVKIGRIGCAACHTAHGSFSNQHLVEFAANLVSPDRDTGTIRYESLPGQGRGRCFMTCHGVNHPGFEYCERGAGCDRGGRVPAISPSQSPLRQKMRQSPFSF